MKNQNIETVIICQVEYLMGSQTGPNGNSNVMLTSSAVFSSSGTFCGFIGGYAKLTKFVIEYDNLTEAQMRFVYDEETIFDLNKSSRPEKHTRYANWTTIEYQSVF